MQWTQANVNWNNSFVARFDRSIGPYDLLVVVGSDALRRLRTEVWIVQDADCHLIRVNCHRWWIELRYLCEFIYCPQFTPWVNEPRHACGSQLCRIRKCQSQRHLNSVRPTEFYFKLKSSNSFVQQRPGRSRLHSLALARWLLFHALNNSCAILILLQEPFVSHSYLIANVSSCSSKTEKNMIVPNCQPKQVYSENGKNDQLINKWMHFFSPLDGFADRMRTANVIRKRISPSAGTHEALSIHSWHTETEIEKERKKCERKYTEINYTLHFCNYNRTCAKNSITAVVFLFLRSPRSAVTCCFVSISCSPRKPCVYFDASIKV